MLRTAIADDRSARALRSFPLRFRPHVLSRKTHKWLGLAVAAQAVIWTLSGLYMTAVDIDIIHGDHFIHAAELKPLPASAIAAVWLAITGLWLIFRTGWKSDFKKRGRAWS